MQAEQLKWSREELQSVVQQYWGYASLRPWQQQTMESVLAGRDSLVVLPTGGGKSLCYQAPAMLQGTTTVVVSPLISLMKDQVDGLRACGVPAIQIDSSQPQSERVLSEKRILQGDIRLLFVSPERLLGSDFHKILEQVRVNTFAIDEAHCISQWGHDFRTEYRQLQRIKELFPHASIPAYTATATERVRSDIIRQLGLENPDVLIGDFDRPNLTYRVLSRQEALNQVIDVIRRHPNEAGIIYCISRKAVNELTRLLQKSGLNAVAYQAGLTSDERRQAQEHFATERCDLIVATVAFGMGIDRSNVRFVMHTGMPKSLEHYQQETGRAGRDGLEAECVLLYSSADLMLWKSIMEKGAATDAVADSSFLETANQHLQEMSRYCRGAICRHRALVEYFDQSYEADNCQACDICLEETAEVADADIVAQKILSCVARVKRPFGIGHIVSVLRGEKTEPVRKWQHDTLSTYGIMSGCQKTDLRDWIDQLIGHGVLERSNLLLANGHSVLVIALNSESLKILRKERTVRLMQPMGGTKEKSKATQADVSWAGVDRELFDALRLLRRQLAQERNWQSYLIFSDATLRELSQVRPSKLTTMLRIKGVGSTKLEDFGEKFLNEIKDHCQARNLTTDDFASLGKISSPP